MDFRYWPELYKFRRVSPNLDEQRIDTYFPKKIYPGPGVEFAGAPCLRSLRPITNYLIYGSKNAQLPQARLTESVWESNVCIINTE